MIDVNKYSPGVARAIAIYDDASKFELLNFGLQVTSKIILISLRAVRSDKTN